MFTKLLSDGYLRNQRILELQTRGLSHSDSLAQTPYNINCLNWVLGHIVVGRDDLLEILGRERIMDGDDAVRYRRDSDPIVEDGPQVLPLDELLSLAHSAREEVSDAVERLTDDQLAEEREWMGSTSTVAEWCHFFYFHDTYHTGQSELLRQVAGAGDTVI